jgi:predicted nucleic acid-binding protein
MRSTTVTSPFTFDANIPIHSVDPTDAEKHRIADQVVDATSHAGHGVPLQCLTEFYRASAKKRILQPEVAEEVVRRTTAMSTLLVPNEDDILHAIGLHRTANVPFFDALLLSTAARSGCTTLFSEDFQYGRTYGTSTVRNPFAHAEAELASLLT